MEEATSATPAAIRSASGEVVRISVIHGDGIAEIRELRGPMIRANIAKALEGSYLHMKVLFEYAGIWPAKPAEETEEPSLAELLLAKMEEKAELPSAMLTGGA
jgi:hypothetical protein